MKVASFLLVTFAVYCLLVLLPLWRHATRVYAGLLRPPVSATVSLIDDGVRVAHAGAFLDYTRAYPPAAVRALDDLQANPLLFHWLNALAPDVQRAIYRYRAPLPPEGSRGLSRRERALAATARPVVVTRRLDVFRLTLEVPLFLALLLALPGIPYRRRLKPLLIGLALFFVIHVALATCVGLWMSARDGKLTLDAAGRFIDKTPSTWLRAPDRYQYIGPVLAFLTTITFLFRDSFAPRAVPTRRHRLLTRLLGRPRPGPQAHKPQPTDASD